MKSKEKEYFDSIADVFDTHFNVYLKNAGLLRVQKRIDLFSKHCYLKPGLKILEIGAGTGEYAKGLSVYGCSLFCADISFNMLNRAVRKVPKQNNIHFFISDIEQLSVKDGVFDAVLGNSVLHHLDIEKALRQILRVLKKGGKVSFAEPNMLNPQIFLQKHIKFLKKLTGDSGTETAFFRWQIKNVFKETGFREVKVEPFDFLHPYTPDCIAKIIDNMSSILEKAFVFKEIAGSLLIKGIK